MQETTVQIYKSELHKEFTLCIQFCMQSINLECGKMFVAALLLLTVSLYQVTLAYSQSTVNMAVIPKESGYCLTAQQRVNTIKQIRGYVNNILNEQQFEIIVTVAPECGDGLWYRVAYLNMTDPSQQCPPVWREYNTSGVRACGRPVNSRGCHTALHNTNGSYSRVCGRVIGFQFGTPDAFNPTCTEPLTMDGVVISHGASQHHIWSYIAGVTQSSSSHRRGNCPCSSRAGAEPPQPVNITGNYYCESGNPTSAVPFKLYANDPLWDGQQCEGTCCSGTNSPPWFSVQLPSITTDMIEVGICGDEYTTNEDTPVQLLEIYVQ